MKELLVSTGSQVETMAPLLRLEPVADEADAADEPAAAGPGLELPADHPDETPAQRAHRLLADLSALVMGFDTDPDYRPLEEYLAVRDELRAADVAVMAGEIGLIGLFADVAELSRNRPAGEDASTELRVHSDREHFHRYLQSLDVERAGLSGQFTDRLSRVLAHYWVGDVARTPELEAAVFRIFLAQQRFASEARVITSLLERWIAESAPDTEVASSARGQLERLVRATQRRFPSVGDLARSIRFRWFDQPQVDAERNQVLAGVDEEVAALAADPDAPDREQRIGALAAVPEQTVGFLAARLADGVPAQEPMLEVLIRKHYTDYDLTSCAG